MERQSRGLSVRSYRSTQPYKKPWQEKFKDFLRNLIAFMFTNVGIIGLVVGYTTAGAVIFMSIEGDQAELVYNIARHRNVTVDRLWDITYKSNILNQGGWRNEVSILLKDYQDKFVLQTQKGVDVTSVQQWSFSGAFLYSLTVITTIGYGNLAPRTGWGKIATVVYAIVGMPLFLLYLSNIGDILARSFKWAYFKMCLCRGCPGSSTFRRRRIEKDIPLSRIPNQQADHHADWQVSNVEEGRKRGEKSSPDLGETENEDSDDEESQDGGSAEGTESDTNNDPQSVTVPVTICLAFMVWYVLVGAFIFKIWEDWSVLDGSYFCFISLSTIGFGDIVPGDKIFNHESENLSWSFVATAVYLMLGMALIAMCFNLMQEEVLHKAKTCISTCKNIFSCCKKEPGEE